MGARRNNDNVMERRGKAQDSQSLPAAPEVGEIEGLEAAPVDLVEKRGDVGK